MNYPELPDSSLKNVRRCLMNLKLYMEKEG